MYFGGLMIRRGGPRSWGLWLSVRAVLTAGMGIGLAILLRSAVLPNLEKESQGAGTSAPASLAWILTLKPWLPLLPVPGLVVGIVAIAIRDLRGVLGPLAALLSLVGVLLVAGSLVAALSGLYQMPGDLGLPQ